MAALCSEQSSCRAPYQHYQWSMRGKYTHDRKTMPLTKQQFANIRIVLVHTSHPGNIGGVARAMKNMGLSELYLVAPKRFPDEEATWRAASAADLLDSAVVVDTVDAAIGDCQLVVGTSARERRIPWPLLNPRESAEQIRQETEVGHRVAVLFGREDRGLTNEELQRCNFHVHIPTDEEYSSLNLAAAVQVICYELRMAMLQQEETKAWREWDVAAAENAEMEYFFEHLERTLTRIGFIDEHSPRQTMNRLRRFYSRLRPDKMELGMLRGMLTAMEQDKGP